MVDQLLKVLCISLFGYSIGFILLELKTKIERSYLYYGIAMALLCIFSAIDLWIKPQMVMVKWIEYQHILACFILPLFIKYLCILKNMKHTNFLKTLFLIASGISILFLFNGMFDIRENVVVPNILYLTTFAPFFLFTTSYINYLIIASFIHSSGFDKKIYLFHIIGFSFLTLSAIMDLMTVINGEYWEILVSFTILGVIGLGILLSYLFTERIILLIQDKDKSLAELTMAYSELEEARSLSELGQSSAMISHEIKNYVHKTLGYMQLVQTTKEVPEEGQRWVEKSIRSIKELSEFSNGILEFSKSKILKNKKQLNICQRISHTISEHFPDRINEIELSCSDENIIVHGDWQKLDNVFMNLFKNSFEAGANKIIVTIVHTHQVSRVTIEDDGCGIASDKVNDIFTAFFSTKLRKGGSGLGLSIVRSIIEGHGGLISAKSKNKPEGSETGIIMNISFPAFEEPMQESTGTNDTIILIKDGLHPLSVIEKTFQNILVKPNSIQDLSEFIKMGNEKNTAIVLGSPETIGKMNKISNIQTCYSIINNNEKGLYVLGNKSDLYSGKFNEEFILNHLLKN